ncbi:MULTISPECIES: hypothetical protein [unclassified Synechocystis]|uniref:hypothetical protein n=1 Tax=unclassified Synechocystis TaxID=2640012 RepID=UPI00187275EC|nr:MULTISPECIES: hypothetical protein [unclassified Synechocystis]MCT0254588.1 hypothetical protein [Synechocystis sp. CS-94]
MDSLTSVILSATILPVLSALGLARCLGQRSEALGKLSEEVFRGDRLPVLPFPVEEEAG